MVGLTWSRRNYAADGCHFTSIKEGRRAGLTDFGVQLVEEAENLGMLIDVSHLNDEGFWDVMEVANKPVIASHSNCRSIADVPRNLSDEQIIAIAKKGGVIGMNASSKFTSDTDENSTVEYLVNHVDHIVELVGIEHVGMGFDFCDQLFDNTGNFTLPAYSRRRFDVLKGHKCIKEFTKSLLSRGYSEEDVELVLGKNFFRIYEQVFIK